MTVNTEVLFAGYNFMMRRILFPIFITLLVMISVLLPSGQVASRPGYFSPNPAASDLIEKLNDLRKSKGLDPYVQNSILMSVAQGHADYIASTGVLTHFDREGKRPYQRALSAGYPVGGDLALGGSFAESIQSGSAITEEDVLVSWQANEVDSLTLFSPDFADVGVGIAAANGVTYFVINAGSVDAQVTASSPTLTSLTVTPGTVIPNTPLVNGEIYHIVQKNEALWSIAITYGTTIAELKLLNSLASDEIFEGQKLLIRRAFTETPTPTEIPLTVTLGIPTSTATQPVSPTATHTPTPLPTAPTSMESGGVVVGGIIVSALLAAALASFLLARKRSDKSSPD